MQGRVYSTITWKAILFGSNICAKFQVSQETEVMSGARTHHLPSTHFLSLELADSPHCKSWMVPKIIAMAKREVGQPTNWIR
jgi:hypothetical protein